MRNASDTTMRTDRMRKQTEAVRESIEMLETAEEGQMTDIAAERLRIMTGELYMMCHFRDEMSAAERCVAHTYKAWHLARARRAEAKAHDDWTYSRKMAALDEASHAEEQADAKLDLMRFALGIDRDKAIEALMAREEADEAIDAALAARRAWLIRTAA